MTNTSRSETRVLIANQNIKEKEFWLDQLSGNPVKSNFPFDFERPRSSDDETHMGEVSLILGGETFAKLMKSCNDSDYTLNAMLITAVKILLNKYTGSGDIMIGTPIYRQQESTDELINTSLVLRTRFEDNITVKQLLLRMIQSIREATENYNYPLELLREKSDIESSHGESSFFDVAVLLENIHDKDYIRDLKLNMTFSFRRKVQSIDGIISFNRSRYRADTVQMIAGHYVNLAGQLLLNIDLPPGAIDILSEDQKHQLLVDFNRTSVDYPHLETIHRLFEKQVLRTPDHMVLEEPGDAAALTYSELNRRANRLAWVLRTRGIRADSIVGLLMERSVDLVWGMLGTLKAGGAYLPIDTRTPIRRIQMMLEDGGVNVLLTRSRVFEHYTITQLQGLQTIKSRPYLTPPRPQIKDIERLPLPDRSLVDYEKYNQFIGEALVKHCMTLFTTRGCPYKCAFCHKIWPKTHVMRSAENIFQEIQLYYKMGVRRFAILDDIFNLNVKNGRRLFEMILDGGLKIQMFFPNGLRGDILTEDYIDLMVEAGTTGMSLALETASPRLQKLIGKRLNLEIFRHNLEYICKKHPRVILELFSMLGFPTETREEAIMTLDFIKSIKWLHFVYVSILKIYPNTDMEKLAIENGITREAIQASHSLSYHELPETLPFDKNFVLQYQADYTNNYFLHKERLLHVLRHQLKIMTESELVQKYSSYLPVEINSFNDLLNFIGVTHDQLGGARVRDEHYMEVPDLNSRLKAHFKHREPDKNALRVLLIDLSQHFASMDELLNNLVEPPLGLIYLMTYLNQKLGSKVNGKIAKTRIDFNNYRELTRLIEEFKPQVIGIRTLSAFKDFFHEAVSVIRQLGCRVPIVSGGPYATSAYETILQDRHVDLIVLGEGEETFVQLIEAFINNSGEMPPYKTLKEIAGLAFIEKNGTAGDAREKFGCEVLAVDRLTDLISRSPGSNPEFVNNTCDLAYVNYTSGSTGIPKGVLVMHRNVIRLVVNSNFVPLSGRTCILQTGSPEFDASTFEVWGSLLNGGKLVLVGNDVILDVENLDRAIRSHNINTMWLSSPLFNQLIQQKSDIFAPLAYLVVGGDALVPAMINRVRKEHPHLIVVNGYGPTENTTFSTTFRIDRDYERGIPIGRPISNSTAYVMDKFDQPVPVGVVGELYVGGDGVSRGYLNNPDLTVEKFCLNHFHSPVYRTGDMVRWMPDGNIEFRGRRDNQLKIRGYRVETDEIEKQLMKISTIREAVVLCFERSDGEKYLCAYIVSRETIDPVKLKNVLSRYLPDYMIPSYFVPVEGIPLTANGKIDRNALQNPEVKIEDQYTAPRNELEEILADIWAEVIEIDKSSIGIDSNFFDMGGHSLNAISLISKIHKALNLKIRLEDIFVKSTIRELAQYIKDASEDLYSSIESVEKKEYYLLSSAQKRLYFIQEMDHRNTAYNVPLLVWLEGKLDKVRLEKSVGDLIKRHESLRTSFKLIKGEPVQQIHRDVEFEIEYFGPFENQSPRQAGSEDREMEKVIQGYVEPFDLSRPPLLRVGLVKLKEETYLLMMDQHHIITDGTSMGIFVRELLALYEGKTLPPVKIRYIDFSQWQNKLLLSGEIKRQEEYWLNRFEGDIPVLNIPADFSRSKLTDFEGGTVHFEIGREQTEKLVELGRSREATLFMVILALYNILLSKLSGRKDIIIGTTIEGRRHADLENVIGTFVNMLALRNYTGDNQSFNSFLQDLKARTLKAFDNQDYQFEDLVSRLNIKRDKSRNPIFDVVFTYNSRAKEESGLTGNEIPVLKPVGTDYIKKISKFDLTLICTEDDDELLFRFDYRAKLFNETTIERFIHYFKEITSAVLDDPEKKISEIELIKEEEMKTILEQIRNRRGKSRVNERVISETTTKHMEVEFNF